MATQFRMQRDVAAFLQRLSGDGLTLGFVEGDVCQQPREHQRNQKLHWQAVLLHQECFAQGEGGDVPHGFKRQKNRKSKPLTPECQTCQASERILQVQLVWEGWESTSLNHCQMLFQQCCSTCVRSFMLMLSTQRALAERQRWKKICADALPFKSINCATGQYTCGQLANDREKRLRHVVGFFVPVRRQATIMRRWSANLRGASIRFVLCFIL